MDAMMFHDKDMLEMEEFEQLTPNSETPVTAFDQIITIDNQKKQTI